MMSSRGNNEPIVEIGAQMLHVNRNSVWSSKIYRTSGPIHVADQSPALYLSCLGRFISTGRFVYQQVSPQCTLHVIESGRGTMISGGKSHDVGAGDIYAFFANHHYHYHDTPKTPWRYTWISLEGTQVSDVLEHVGITPESPLLHGDYANVLEKLFQEIAAVYQRPTITPTFAVAAGWRIIDALADAGADATQARSAAESARFIMDRQTHDVMSVERLAESLGLSRSALFRQFRETFGISPKEYQDALRISRAQSLLRQSSSSLKQVAIACGYTSSSYFIRAFRKHCGKSPGQWRQSMPAKPSHRKKQTRKNSLA